MIKPQILIACLATTLLALIEGCSSDAAGTANGALTVTVTAFANTITVTAGDAESSSPNAAQTSLRTSALTPPPVTSLTTSLENATQGWLLATPTWVGFLSWTRTDPSVSGTLSYVNNSRDTQDDPNHGSIGFNGAINGTSFTLNFIHLPNEKINFDLSQASGYVTSTQLTLSVPGRDGILTTVEFTPATATEFNLAVQQLNSQATTAIPTS
jgi:hypothetical protein